MANNEIVEQSKEDTPITVITKTDSPGWFSVVTPKGREVGMSQAEYDGRRDEGLTTEEIGVALDEEQDGWDEYDAQVSDDQDDVEGYRHDYEDEDPLAGDVDPTGGYREEPNQPLDAHMNEVMRQHGDFTG